MKLKQRFLSLFLAIGLLALALPLNALAATAAEYEAYQTENGGYLRINRFTNTLDGAANITGDLVIPSIVGKTTVKYIADGVFYDFSKLTSVTVPATVETIGDRAFGACTSLKSVKLNDGLTSLGKEAFRYCYSLTEITLPSTLTTLMDLSFDSCVALRSVTIPDSVTKMGIKVFQGCEKLTSVTLPAGITEIGEYAFSNCFSLTSVRLPEKLQDISTALFSGCTSLNSVQVYNAVRGIGQSAFRGCTSLQTLILPEGVQHIDQWAFDGCAALSKLSVPNSVSVISADAFYGCDNLTLYVNAGTLAQVFASANHIPFEVGTLNSNNPPTPAETPFVDIEHHWGKSYIEWAYSKGYFKGITETKFGPNVSVNRGMVASVLYRIEGEPSSASSSFSDVPEKAYYASAVGWGESTGVMAGMGGGKFAPARNITREQLATMLYRYAEYKRMDTSRKGDLTEYKDGKTVSSFAGKAMEWAVGSGIVTGRTGAVLDPKGNATRAETTAMLKRFAELK